MPIAGILGSPVSGLILDRVHWLGLSSWRWLLILEGIPAVACGLLTYFLLPTRPDEAKFLTTNEKQWLRTELAREEQQKVEQRQFSTLQALTSGRVWHLVAIYFGMLAGLYSLNFWAPQLVKSLSSGFSNSFIGFLSEAGDGVRTGPGGHQYVPLRLLATARPILLSFFGLPKMMSIQEHGQRCHTARACSSWCFFSCPWSASAPG